jgi:hypothetical protein
MKVILLLFLSFFFISVSAQQVPKFIRTVYDAIYNTMDNGQVIKPTLVYSNETTEVASFEPSTNQIYIGAEFIKIARNFGADSSNVVAHVLGHELAHILLQQNDFIKNIGSGYASASYNLKLKKLQKTLQDTVYERQADEYSALFTYMSGYKTLAVATRVLDSIYIHFNLKDKQLSKYPTLAERKLILQNVGKRMKALTEVFDDATLALIGGKYDMALAMYQTFVKEKFPSCEIYNNIGLIHLLKAINSLDKKEYPYLFPCEIDVTSRLKEDSERSLSEDSEENLIEAIRNFELALKNKAYSTAWLNKAIAEMLLNRPEDYAISLKMAERNASTSILEKINILNTIIVHKKGNKEQALATFKSLAPTNTLAAINLQRITDTNYLLNESRTEKIVAAELLPIIQMGQKLPAVDFFSSQAKSTDSLKYILKFERNLSKMQIYSQEFNTSRWYYKGGEIKPSMMLYVPTILPTLLLTSELIKNADSFYSSNTTTFLKYDRLLLKFQADKIVQCIYLN